MRRLLLLALPAVLAGLLALAAPARLVAQQITYGPVVGGAGGMSSSASNAVAGSTKDNLGLVRDFVKDFGATCDGTTDDAAAFAAAKAWMATAPKHPAVTLPVGTCATSQTVEWGDGRQLSTTLTAGLAGGETSLPVASIAGILNGDKIALKLDASSTSYQQLTVNGTPAAGSIPVTPAVSGAAASGNVVYAGTISTYNGGGFIGQGSGSPSVSTTARVSVIKYIGAAAPTTTLSATVSSGQTISVADASNIHLGNAIRIVLDSGNTFWTWVDQTPAGTTVHLGNQVPSAATSGNSVIIANNPVVRINGHILNPILQGVLLDANNLAAVGLESIGSYSGQFTGNGGVVSVNYTGIGHWLHPMVSVFGNGAANNDNEFELYANAPNNANTVGLWFNAGNNACFCRNRFIGGTFIMGGHDTAAAAIYEGRADNNTFIKPFTNFNGANISGAGLYRMPQTALNSIPTSNVWIGAALKGGIAHGTLNDGSSIMGNDNFWQYGIDDSEPIPGPTLYSVKGQASDGTFFNARSLGITRADSARDFINLYTTTGTYLWGLGRDTGASEGGALALEATNDIAFYTNAAGTPGSGTLVMELHEANGVEIGAPTGGGKGAGTLNVAKNLYSNGLPLPVVVCQGGAGNYSTTSASEVNLIACALPTTIGTAGKVLVETVWSYTSSGNTKQLIVRHSTSSGATTGTLAVNSSATTTTNAKCNASIWNAAATNSQRSASYCYIGPTSLSSSAPITGSIDTAAANYININGSVAGGETLTLVAYTVTFYPGQ